MVHADKSNTYETFIFFKLWSDSIFEYTVSPIQPTQVMLVPRFSMVIYLLEWKQVLVIACLMEHSGFIVWFRFFFVFCCAYGKKNHIYIFLKSISIRACNEAKP